MQALLMLMGSVPAMVPLSCPPCDVIGWLAFFAGIGVSTIGYFAMHHYLKD